MLSIVIADDEEGIVDLCRSLIKYPEAIVIGEASNGIALFEKIKELRPNTVITDICMPGMTGIELVEKAKEEYPDVNFIVMSGYTDFEYAQTLLRYGVWDYLVKPLGEPELNHALEKLDHQLKEKESQVQYYSDIKEHLHESIEVLRERYLKQIWKSSTAAPVPVIGNIKVLNTEDTKVQCLLLGVDSNFSISYNQSAAMVRQIESELENLNQIAADSCRTVCMFSDGAYIVFSLFFDAVDAEEKSREFSRIVRDKLRVVNSQNHLVHVTAAGSYLQSGSIEDLIQCYHQADTALKWRLEKKHSNMIVYDKETERILGEIELFKDTKEERELKNTFEKLDVDAVSAVMQKIWLAYKKNAQAVGYRYRLMEEVLNCINDAISQLPQTEELSASMEHDIYKVISNGYEAEAIAHYLEEYAKQLIQKYQEVVSNKENRIILTAKRYIRNHYAETMSLEQIAKEVCLSSTYFSKLFKQETGSGFLEYLQKVRIEKAQELLRESQMRVRDIAEAVGYRDFKFFNKIFFRETNVKPSEYRKFYSR